MICPKCGHENEPGSQECLLCGVIFAKIKQRLVPAVPVPEIGVDSSHAGVDGSSYGSQSSDTLRDLFLPESGKTNSFIVWGRGLILLGMIIWGSQLMFASIASNTAGESLLHLVNLPFHEAGHVIFRPLGQFIPTLGGTLGQLIIPLICGGVLLLKTRDPFGAAVCSWWFGENFAFDYDSYGNLQTLTDPQQNITRFEYDLAGRKTKEIRPLLQETSTSYYQNGLLKTVKDAKQQTTSYSYGNIKAGQAPFNV